MQLSNEAILKMAELDSTGQLAYDLLTASAWKKAWLTVKLGPKDTPKLFLACRKASITEELKPSQYAHQYTQLGERLKQKSTRRGQIMRWIRRNIGIYSDLRKDILGLKTAELTKPEADAVHDATTNAQDIRDHVQSLVKKPAQPAQQAAAAAQAPRAQPPQPAAAAPIAIPAADAAPAQQSQAADAPLKSNGRVDTDSDSDAGDLSSTASSSSDGLPRPLEQLLQEAYRNGLSAEKKLEAKRLLAARFSVEKCIDVARETFQSNVTSTTTTTQVTARLAPGPANLTRIKAELTLIKKVEEKSPLTLGDLQQPGINANVLAWAFMQNDDVKQLVKQDRALCLKLLDATESTNVRYLTTNGGATKLNAVLVHINIRDDVPEQSRLIELLKRNDNSDKTKFNVLQKPSSPAKRSHKDNRTQKKSPPDTPTSSPIKPVKPVR